MTPLDMTAAPHMTILDNADHSLFFRTFHGRLAEDRGAHAKHN